MARKPNNIETAELKIRTTPLVHRYLDSLVASGLYGKTRPDAAERLITRSIELLIKDGSLKRIKR